MEQSNVIGWLCQLLKEDRKQRSENPVSHRGVGESGHIVVRTRITEFILLFLFIKHCIIYSY